MTGDDGSGSGSGSGDFTPLPDPINGFQIVSPPITLTPGEEQTYCYYFQTPNTTEADVNQWVSAMTDGSHHLIVYFTQAASGKEGQAPTVCGGQGLRDTWTYSAQEKAVTLSLPADDGAGKPLAMKVPPGQFGYVQMHYLNVKETSVDAHVEINANGLAAGTAFTPTAAFITYEAGFTVPKTADTVETEYTVSNTCAVPAGKQFWTMSTHAHKQAKDTHIVDDAMTGAGAMVFDSTDWEHPGAVSWNNPTFKTFAGSFTNSCTYLNTTGHDISEGPSAATNEMCMAVGYMFPADKPAYCLNGNVGSF